jgi:hypothetical protein
MKGVEVSENDKILTQEWLAEKLEAEKLEATEVRLEREEERRQESALESYIASGGNPVNFPKAYPAIRERMLAEETISREQAHQRQAARQVRQMF